MKKNTISASFLKKRQKPIGCETKEGFCVEFIIYGMPRPQIRTSTAAGRWGGLMFSALVSGSSGLGWSPGRGHCVVFLGKTHPIQGGIKIVLVASCHLAQMQTLPFFTLRC